MSGQRDDDYGHSLDWQAVSGQDVLLLLAGSPMDEPHNPDQDARCASHHQMHQEDAFRFLSLEFPLPRKNSSDYDRHGRDCRDEQIVVGRRNQQGLLLPLRKKIKEDADDKQRDREVDQHHMLRMLRENYCFYVERMQGRSSLSAR